MEFILTEPTHPRYIYVNPKTNVVHLLMPIVSGQTIGTDNTCKTAYGLQEFFGLTTDVHQQAILKELRHYKEALEFDLSLIPENTELNEGLREKMRDLKEKKQSRLLQIKQHQASLEVIQNSGILKSLKDYWDTMHRYHFPEYPKPLKTLMKEERSNFYSMLLRPGTMDSYLRLVNPVFSVKRDGKQVLYSTLSNAFKDVTPLGALVRLINRVLASPEVKECDFNSESRTPEEKENDFKKLQSVLTAETKRELDKRQLEAEVNYSIDQWNKTVTKEHIDSVIMADKSLTTEEYIKAMIDGSAPHLFDAIEESPFYRRKNAEDLSIITQFFLGSVNIYCRAKNKSTVDFGAILDNDEALSEAIAAIILSIYNGDSIEDALLDFINEKKESFGLKEALTPVDYSLIKTQFMQNYKTIKGSPHFDEFALLDDTKAGLFISHQGSICLNIAEFIRAGFPELAPQHVEAVLADFDALKGNISHSNPGVHATVELSIKELLAAIKDEAQLDAVLKRLQDDQKREILASPKIKKLQLPKFLHCIARGQQDEAEGLLKDNPDADLLLNKATFTDYSGRTFNCTAYEYAYWAKDTHMCRMLENHMDDKTKALMLMRCAAIESRGLTYKQHGKEIQGSKHFDLTPLTEALKAYVDGYDAWIEANNFAAMKAAWMKVGLAQRDVPAHVINEYCRRDRSFDPLPSFNVKEDKLPRELTYYNDETGRCDVLFPLVISDSSGLGVDFALIRLQERAYALTGSPYVMPGRPRHCGWTRAIRDFAAVSRLDEVRIVDLKQSLDNLKPIAPESGLGLSFS